MRSVESIYFCMGSFVLQLLSWSCKFQIIRYYNCYYISLKLLIYYYYLMLTFRSTDMPAFYRAYMVPPSFNRDSFFSTLLPYRDSASWENDFVSTDYSSSKLSMVFFCSVYSVLISICNCWRKDRMFVWSWTHFPIVPISVVTWSILNDKIFTLVVVSSAAVSANFSLVIV